MAPPSPQAGPEDRRDPGEHQALQPGGARRVPVGEESTTAVGRSTGDLSVTSADGSVAALVRFSSVMQLLHFSASGLRIAVKILRRPAATCSGS
jgi:hypothetical protein